ncbi:hypothetical protein GCM10009839_57730 [Catenulispora yoronensis]|uniref:Uncharacterized protein n=1 Tax=Catenulispora yoronensis TaxID=450799 RepID=A0ABP5GIY0_9ACTN
MRQQQRYGGPRRVLPPLVVQGVLAVVEGAGDPLVVELHVAGDRAAVEVRQRVQGQEQQDQPGQDIPGHDMLAAGDLHGGCHPSDPLRGSPGPGATLGARTGTGPGVGPGGAPASPPGGSRLVRHTH